MALTKIKRTGLDTGITDNSDANAITIDSSENTTFAGNLTIDESAGTSASAVLKMKADRPNEDHQVAEIIFYNGGNTDLGQISAHRGSADNYGDITFSTRGAGGHAERLRINESGNATFSGHITLQANKQIFLGNAGDYIYGSGTHLYVVSSDDLNLTASGNTTIDTAYDINLDSDQGNTYFKDGGTQYGALKNSSGNLIIQSGSTTMLTGSGANATFAGNITMSGTEKKFLIGSGTSGHFGLGTSDGSDSGYVSLSAANDFGAGRSGYILLYGEDYTGGGSIAKGKVTIAAGNGSGGSGLSGGISFATGGTSNRMVILSDGKVGIGTAVPIEN